MKKKFIFKLSLVLFLFGGLIFFRQSGPVAYLRRRLLESSLERWRLHSSQSIGADLLAEKDLTIKALEFDNDELKRQKASLEEALLFKKNNSLNYLRGAKVIFYSKDFGREFLVIDQGQKSGLKNGDLVIDEKGILVGVVQDAGEDFSKIDIASNPGRSFEVELRNLGVKALTEGLGARTSALKLIPSHVSLKKGEVVSLSGVRIKPIMVGEVSEVKESGVFLEARVISLARPEWLTDVFIISL